MVMYACSHYFYVQKCKKKKKKSKTDKKSISILSSEHIYMFRNISAYAENQWPHLKKPSPRKLTDRPSL